MNPTVNLKKWFPGSGSKSGSSTCRCVRVRFILPGTTYPVYTGSTVHILYPGNADDERPTHRPPDHKRKCWCCCCLFSCTCYALELATLICCEVDIQRDEFCRLVTKLFPKDGTIVASQFHVCCSPYPGEREREIESPD